MDFATLHETLPYVIGKKEHVLEYRPYPGVTLKFPGKHQADTDPPGGDFVVCVTDIGKGWIDHQFTHTDLFAEFERRIKFHHKSVPFMINYAKVVKQGIDPADSKYYHGVIGPGDLLNDKILLCALQCLAVAEHRRYAKFESKGGGRYLPARFASGIVLGAWTAADAAGLQKKGRPGVEMLEKSNGVRTLDEWCAL